MKMHGDTDAKWSDNFFDILPGIKKEVKVRTSKPIEPEDFRRSLQVTHLDLLGGNPSAQTNA